MSPIQQEEQDDQSSSSTLLPSSDVYRDHGDVYKAHQPINNASSGRISKSRWLALIAVCTMSIGGHFATYLLGPLKSRLHREMNTSNSQFSLLVASFNLNSTWTPLVAGLFIARFGTAWSSIATTGVVLLGQLILFLGVIHEHLSTMTFGLFIFGLGLTPIAVTQETLLAHLSPTHTLGLSLALGLVSGKSSSFISSLVSLPLADAWGDKAPFGVAIALCIFSFGMNALRLASGWGAETGAAQVKEKRLVKWGGADGLGDVFWFYILFNVLSGAIWQPFIHLSANLVQNRYNVSETAASIEASVLLAGAIILYPIIGSIADRIVPETPKTTFHLVHLSSISTLLGYTYLTLPPTLTLSPWPGLLLFALGHGMATLLMVILVPKFLPPHLVPLGLGLHKSLEMASSSLSQTLAGMWLDGKDNASAGGEGLLRIFWSINAVQLGCSVLLWLMEERRRKKALTSAEEYERLPMGELGMEEEEGIEDPPVKAIKAEPSSGLASSEAERTRSRWFFGCALIFILLVWAVFLVDAWSEL